VREIRHLHAIAAKAPVPDLQIDIFSRPSPQGAEG
jgi:hypothetical protein